MAWLPCLRNLPPNTTFTFKSPTKARKASYHQHSKRRLNRIYVPTSTSRLCHAPFVFKPPFDVPIPINRLVTVESLVASSARPYRVGTVMLYTYPSLHLCLSVLLVGIMTLGLGMTLAMTLIGERGEIGVTYHVYIVCCSVGRTLTVYPPTEPH